MKTMNIIQVFILQLVINIAAPVMFLFLS